MNPYLQGLLASAFGEQVNKRTGFGDRIYGILSDVADAIVPAAAASDASTIRQYPTTTSGQPATTAPYQRKFGAPGLMFREGAPDSTRGITGLRDRMDYVAEDGFSGVQPDWLPQSLVDQAIGHKFTLAEQAQMTGELPEGYRSETAPSVATASEMSPTTIDITGGQQVPVGAEVIEGPTTPEDDAPGMYPNGKPEEGGSFFGSLADVWGSTFGDDEWRLRKAIALNSMRLSPDQGLTASLTEQLKTARTKRGMPQTVQALINMGQNDLAAMVQAGQLSPKEALTIAYKSPKTSYTLKKGSEISPNLPPDEMYKVSSQGDVEPVYDKPLSETAGTETIKAFAPVLKDVYDAASSGMKEVKNIDKNLDMLNTGDAYTGMFAEYKKDLSRFMSTMGSELAKRGASQTEILQSALQAGVFKAFVEAGLTSKQMDTPAEREMIMKAFSGDITLTKEALIELQNRRREKAIGNIQKYDEFRQGGAYDAAKQYVKIPYLDTSGVKYQYQYQPPAGMKKKQAGGFKRDASGRLVPIF